MGSCFHRKELIYTVYQEKSISKAAQKLFVSQPSLSTMIRKIEEEIGVPLFDRTSKPIRMTEAGMEYVKATEAIMHIEKAFDNYINTVNDLLTGSLTVGGNQLLSSLVLPQYIARFIQRYPNIQLHLADDNSIALENMISSGQLDLVIDNRKLDAEIFEQHLWRIEHLLLAVPAGFACNRGLEQYRLREEDILDGSYLAPEVKPVPLAGFADVPFVAMTKDNETRRRSDEIFREAGIMPNHILEIDRLVTLYNFVEIGAAASVVSDTLVRHIQHHNGKVVFYRLSSSHAQREIYVSYKRNRYYSKAMEAFVELCFLSGNESNNGVELMTPELLAQYISIQTPTAWVNCYEAAMEQYRPGWLDELDFEYILDYYGFSEDDCKPRLRQEIALLKQDATLNRVCWLMHYILFYAPGTDLLNGWRWKGDPKAYAQHGSFVTNAVALLAGQPLHEQGMAERHYDAEQIAFHIEGVRATWEGQHEDREVDGISFDQMVWGAYFMRCTLVRIGRLEYECGLKERHEYDHMFGGEPCYISIHIPPSENGLKDEEVDASVRLAVEHLEDYFPQTKGRTKVFLTRTWLLSPELKEILKPDSNIMKFQNRFTLLDTYPENSAFLSFVFKVSSAPDLDYNTLPEDTGLRRAIKQRLVNGETLHTALGYFVV